MTNEEKILFFDRMVDMIPKNVSEDIPIMIGTLNKRQGINGFVVAEIGHPVFELKDRYIIYLESINPEKIAKFGEPTVFKHITIAIPYYKETLAPIIDFT